MKGLPNNYNKWVKDNSLGGKIQTASDFLETAGVSKDQQKQFAQNVGNQVKEKVMERARTQPQPKVNRKSNRKQKTEQATKTAQGEYFIPGSNTTTSKLKEGGELAFFPKGPMGYDVFNGTTKETPYSSPLDTTMSPYDLQGSDQPDPGKVNNCRTVGMTIASKFFERADILNVFEDIVDRMTIKVVENSNGGNSSVSSLFIGTKLYDYYSNAWHLLFTYVQLVSVMAWNADVTHGNLTLRRLAIQTNTQEFMQLRNEMAEALGNVALPPRMIDYAYWLAQTYMTNSNDTSIDQRFIDLPLFQWILIRDNFASYRGDVEVFIRRVNCDLTVPGPPTFTRSERNTITNYLVFKSGMTHNYLRGLAVPKNESCFDGHYNDLYQNMPQTLAHGGTWHSVPASLDDTGIGYASLSIKGGIPLHVMDSFATQFTNMAPILYNTQIEMGGDSPFAGEESNKFVMYLDSTDTVEVKSQNHIHTSQIGNNVINATTQHGVAWAGAPKGDQEHYSQLSKRNLEVAQRKFAFWLWGIEADA